MGTDSFISSGWSSSGLPSITDPIGCLSTTLSSALTRLCCCFSFFKTCASLPVSTDTAVTAVWPHYNHGLILPHHWDFYSVLVSHPRSCRLNCPQCPFISPVTLLLQSVHGCAYWKKKPHTFRPWPRLLSMPVLVQLLSNYLSLSLQWPCSRLSLLRRNAFPTGVRWEWIMLLIYLI